MAIHRNNCYYDNSGNFYFIGMMKIQMFVFLFILINSYCYGQKKDSLNVEFKFPNNDVIHKNELKSKSHQTVNATIINITRRDLLLSKYIQDIITIIPHSCDIISCTIHVKFDDNLYTYSNFGNEIIGVLKKEKCKWIIIENIVSKCPTSHNANYKIVVH